MPSNRIAYLTVTNELLIQALHLPPGTQILGGFTSREFPNAMQFCVEHAELLPELDGSGRIPTVGVTISQTTDDSRMVPTMVLVSKFTGLNYGS